MLKKLLEWDRDTFVYLNNLGLDEYDIFWTTVTDFRTWIPLFLAFIALIFWKYPKREALFVVLTVVATLLFVAAATDITKYYVARLRPNNNEEINTLIRILKSPTTFSFFSGHASSSFSVTTIVVLFLRRRFKWCWLFYLWPLLFATSRIFVGVHYPVDIIVGLLFGILSAIMFYNIYIKVLAPYLKLPHP